MKNWLRKSCVIMGILISACSHETVLLPVEVSTVGIPEIYSTTAVIEGSIIGESNSPIKERGVCWSTSVNPTVDDFKANLDKSVNFLADLTGLTKLTTYHARAYAINDAGVSYGDDLTFTTIDYDIYVCGNSGDGPAYWKNGVMKKLQDASTSGSARAMAVSFNNNVHLAGEINGVPKYWLVTPGGVTTTDLPSKSKQCSATGIFVRANGDVYIAGYDGRTPVYWKNGQRTDLTNGTYSELPSSISLSITGDIYVVGRVFQGQYWKNGLSQKITDGAEGESAIGIVLTPSNDLYLAGYRTSRGDWTMTAKYWKNGIATSLSDGKKSTEADDIFISSTGNVHVVGRETKVVNVSSTNAKYWLNGLEVKLGVENEADSRANRVAVSEKGDVYIAGSLNYYGAIWKNGVLLTHHNSTDFGSPELTGIVLKKI